MAAKVPDAQDDAGRRARDRRDMRRGPSRGASASSPRVGACGRAGRRTLCLARPRATTAPPLPPLMATRESVAGRLGASTIVTLSCRTRWGTFEHDPHISSGRLLRWYQSGGAGRPVAAVDNAGAP
eukprot:scaffold1411_cov396-Prasinococcus_capsulatus_cf.AAC.9